MITYEQLKHAEDAGPVIEMMKALYAEDPFAPEARHEQFPRTIDHLLASPQSGRVILFVDDQTVCGYALLIRFWSNEFGGNVLVIDELYVRPEARNRGIARGLFAFLKLEKPYSAVVLGLEVNPSNDAARRLYRSSGFVPRKNLAMTCRL